MKDESDKKRENGGADPSQNGRKSGKKKTVSSSKGKRTSSRQGTGGEKSSTGKGNVQGGTPKKRGRKKRLRWMEPEVNPLGYRYLPEGPVRHPPKTFSALLPDLIAKYGLGRKLSIAKFQETFDAILDELFPESSGKDAEKGGGGEDFSSSEMDLWDGGGFGLIDKKSFRLVGFKAGTIQIEVSDAPLLSELSFFEGEILQKFQEALPEEKIRKIRLTLK